MSLLILFGSGSDLNNAVLQQSRLATLGPWMRTAPIPVGTLDQEDRQHVLGVVRSPLASGSSSFDVTASGGIVLGGSATVRSGVHTEKTWAFTSGLESWVGNPGPNQFLDQYVFDGNPAGSLISEIADQNITDSGYWEWTGTWEQLGVPTGAEVYSIALMGVDTRVFAYNKANYATFGPYELRDNSSNLLATLWEGRTATAQEAGWTAEGAQPMKSVPDAQKSSNTSIKIRLNNAMQTNNAGGLGHQVSLLEDNIFIRIVNSPIYNRTGSGNVTITGANNPSQAADRTASGGIILAGSSTVSLIVSRTGSGAITLGGTATTSPAYSFTGSGSVALAGAATTGFAVSRTGSGGITLGGSATATLVVSFSGSGAITIGGSALVDSGSSRTGSGGIVIGGSLSPDAILSPTVSGGLTIEGSSGLSLSAFYTGSGGVVIAGAFDYEPVYTPAPTGGVTLSGTADSELLGGSTSYLASYYYGRRRPPRGRLNHGNPHTDGLAFYVSDTGASPRNLVDGKTGTMVDQTLGSWSAATLDGPGLESTSTSLGGFYWGFPERLRGVTDFTMVWYGRLDSWANFGKLLCLPYRQNATWDTPFVAMGLSIENNFLSIEFADATDTRRNAAPSATGSLSSPPRQPMLLAGVRSGTSFTTYRALHTGFFQGTTTVAGASGQSPNFAEIGVDPNVYLFQRNHDNKAEGVDGVCLMAAIYRRALTASEILDLYTEPFAPSRPSPTFYSFMSASAFDRDATGGAVIGGTAAPGLSISPAPSGGLVLGGTVSSQWTHTTTASGGIVLGGTNAGSIGFSRTAAGGIVIAGSGLLDFSNNRTAAGGIVISGSGSLGLSASKASSGGIVIGGSSSSSLGFSRTVSGGLIVGGTAIASASFSLTGSGEIRILGTIINPQAITFDRFASGGIILSGESDLLRGYLHYPSGGIRISGVRERDADYSANFTATIQSGPIILGGSATPSTSVTLNPTFSMTASGGVVISGSATPVFEVVLNPTFNLTASGGIVLGGGVLPLSLSVSPAPSGGIVIGGSFDVTLTTYPPVGQVFWLARTPIIGMGSL